MESAALGRPFGFLGGAATELGDKLPQLPLPLDDSSAALVQFVESLGGQRAEQSQFLFVFATVLFQQAKSRPHDFAGVLESPRSHLIDDELVVAARQIDISCWHFRVRLLHPKFTIVSKNCQLYQRVVRVWWAW